MIEIERKYRLPDGSATDAVLNALPQSAHEVRQEDTIYLQDAGSFAEVDRERGYAVLRSRRSGDNTTITAKRRRTSESALEAEVVTDAATARTFFEILAWNEVTRVSKSRRESIVNGVHVAFDMVDNLGAFIELELLVADEKEVGDALELIKSVAARLGLNEAWIEPRKYDELISVQSESDAVK